MKNIGSGQTQSPVAPPRSGRGEERESERDIRKGVMKKRPEVKVIEGKEINRDNPIEYLIPKRFEAPIVLLRVMTVKEPQNKKISEE